MNEETEGTVLLQQLGKKKRCSLADQGRQKKWRYRPPLANLGRAPSPLTFYILNYQVFALIIVFVKLCFEMSLLVSFKTLNVFLQICMEFWELPLFDWKSGYIYNQMAYISETFEIDYHTGTDVDLIQIKSFSFITFFRFLFFCFFYYGGPPPIFVVPVPSKLHFQCLFPIE